MKKHIFLLLLLISTASVSFSQTVTNTEALQNFAKEKAVKSQNNRDAVNDYVQRYNIPIRIKSNGKVTELMFIDDFGLPQYYITHNENAAKTISSNKVYSGGGAGLSLSGSGVTVCEWDGGTVLTSHQEFEGRVTNGDATSHDDHATHVAGTIMAAGTVSAAKGMAFSASLTSYDWSDDESEMASEAAGGALISNHSYGTGRGWSSDGDVWYGNTSISNDEDYLFGFYNSWAADWDEIAYNAPYYLIVKSAGNDRNDTGDGSHNNDGAPDGYDCIGPKGVAKNILTVGAVDDITSGWSQASDVGMTSFSSWGPADDGRIKPDIVANGYRLYSSLNESNDDYAYYSGTSMSAPSVTGSAALLIEHYEDVNGSGAKMKASTLKALIINTADEAGLNTGPDYMFGWGLMNTESAAAKITEDQTTDAILEHYLSNGSSYTRDITTSGTSPLKITVVWTDPVGIPVAASLDPSDAMLVNDLDLKITQSSNTYYPWSLSAANPANAATNSGENNVDNVETVYIASPANATTYTITIDHDGALSGGGQAFSMIISGDIVNTIAPVADFYADNTTPAVNADVQFADASANIPTSWQWTFSPSTVTYKNSTSSTSQNPVVEFNDEGRYTVTLLVTNATGSDDTTKTDYIATPVNVNWTGTTSTDWNTSSNWSNNYVPASGDNVTIPGNLSNYPSVDESNTVCYDLDIQNGGQVVIATGGNLAIGNNLTILNGGLFKVNDGTVTVTNELLVGEGTSGTFDLNGGSVTVTKNFNSETGCTVDISGGSLDIGEDWRRSVTEYSARGTINLSGGTIIVRDDCAFSSSGVSGSMTGDFQMTVWDDFQNNDIGWNTVTGGTITLIGAYGYPYLFSTNSDYDVIAYNLVLNGPGSIFYLCSSSFNHGIIIKNNLTFTAGTVVTINDSYHTDNFNVTGQFSMGSGAHFKDAIKTTDSYSVGSFSFDAASIYEYYGSNQTIQYDPTYGDLYISTSSLADINSSLDIDEDLYIETSGTLTLATGASIDVLDDIIINDGGLLKVNDGEVTMHDDLVVGQESSGEFEQNGGTVTVTNDFSTRAGCTIDINGGTLNILSNWDNNGNGDGAQGNIELSGGIIDLADRFIFEYTNVTGTMDGTNMSVGGNFDIDGADWTMSAGTITFDGSSTQEIDGEVVATIAFNNVVIESESSVDIDGATSFSGTFVVESDATNSGSLIVTTAGSVAGNVTYERWMAADKWHIVSAPVEGQDISGLLDHPTNGNSIAYKNSVYGVTNYLEDSNEWGNYYTGSTDGDFTNGVGYLMRRQTTDGTVSFTGTVATGDVTSAVTLNGNGWNAVGNPYTSAIGVTSAAASTEKFLVKNEAILDDSYEALYVWNPATSDYVIVNNSGTGWDVDYIQAGQGFIVRANANGNITFTTSMQKHQTSQVFKSAKIPWPGLVLKANKNDEMVSTAIAFNDDMTTGLDPGYDAGIFKGDNDLNIFTQLIEDNGVEFGLQCLPLQNIESMEIPIGLDATTAGEITLSIEKDNFPETVIPVLNDKLLNTQFAFSSESDIYTATVNDNTKGFGRFFLSFASTTDAENIAIEKQHFKAWFSNGKINIYGETTGTEIARVYTISGQEISNTRLDRMNLNTIELPVRISGIYLIRIEKQNGTEVLKVPVFFN